MLIKASIEENGVRRDIFIDPNRDWVAIKFSAVELMHLAHLSHQEMFIAAPIPQLNSNPAAIRQWALSWPNRYYAGSHKAPEGGLILPDGTKIKQDGNN